LSLLLLLQTRGRLNATELASLLEVSVRTVHRDVEQLSAAGVPVYAVRGRDGGFELLPGWQKQLAGLTTGEAEALSLAAVPGVARVIGIDRELGLAQLKLAASRATEPMTLESRLHVDPTRWFFDEEHPPALAAVFAATMASQRVRLTYRRASVASTRIVDPLGLVLKAGVWYLVAANRARVASYRVSQIEAAITTDEVFDRPAGFELAEAWATAVRAYETGLVTTTARIRVTPACLQRLAAGDGVIARAITELPNEVGPDGLLDVEIPIESIDHAVRTMLDPEIEVLDPPGLRDRLREAAQMLARRYAVTPVRRSRGRR
jgi:predicted DNA-binding transcriptional regulator YafY